MGLYPYISLRKKAQVVQETAVSFLTALWAPISGADEITGGSRLASSLKASEAVPCMRAILRNFPSLA
jgi:hypothetical protein